MTLARRVGAPLLFLALFLLAHAANAASRTWLMTTPEGRTEQVALDVKGRVIEVDAPSRAPARVAYDSNGRVTGVTQDARNWGFAYDARSNVQSSTDPNAHTWHYGYDAVGRTTSVQRADGQSTSIAYDLNGHVAAVTPPGKTAHDFTYTTGEVPRAYKPPTASGTAANDTDLHVFGSYTDLWPIKPGSRSIPTGGLCPAP